MQNPTQSIQGGHARGRTTQRGVSAERLAIDEYELAARWGLSVRTIRRWRQEHLGPVFCKLGARVTYLISEIEAFEQRNARHSTSARAYA
jgi:hypothetical protein